MSIKKEVRSFILDNSSLEALNADEDIFDTGAVTSMFVMQLVTFIENRAGIVVQGDDLTFENFRTLNSIEAFFNRKTAS